MQNLSNISVIAFDGDDTLWHNESIFSVTQDRFRRLLRGYVDEKTLDDRLLSIERNNLRVFGYGVKGFVLSMIETSIEASGGKVTAGEIQAIIGFGKEMLQHPVELLDGVRDTIEALAKDYRLMLITKGDLFDQQSKIARSGLVEHFWKVEIVSEKDEHSYRRILDVHGICPEEFVMVGNSLRSDVLPVVTIGASAVYVPYHLLWAHEHIEADLSAHERIQMIECLADLPAVLEELSPTSPGY